MLFCCLLHFCNLYSFLTWHPTVHVKDAACICCLWCLPWLVAVITRSDLLYANESYAVSLLLLHLLPIVKEPPFTRILSDWYNNYVYFFWFWLWITTSIINGRRIILSALWGTTKVSWYSSIFNEGIITLCIHSFYYIYMYGVKVDSSTQWYKKISKTAVVLTLKFLVIESKRCDKNLR